MSTGAPFSSVRLTPFSLLLVSLVEEEEEEEEEEPGHYSIDHSADPLRSNALIQAEAAADRTEDGGEFFTAPAVEEARLRYFRIHLTCK